MRLVLLVINRYQDKAKRTHDEYMMVLLCAFRMCFPRVVPELDDGVKTGEDTISLVLENHGGKQINALEMAIEGTVAIKQKKLNFKAVECSWCVSLCDV